MPPSKRFNVPYLGFGIGLRPPHYHDLLETSPQVDWLELISENFMLEGGRSLAMLDQFKERYRLIPHGVSLSIGASDPLDWDYLRRLKKLLQSINAPWFSDHLCWSQMGGAHMHNLLPLVYTEDVAAFVADKIRVVQDFMERPFLVENVSSYVEFKDSKMTEWEFLVQVVERADCGILLDINNVYVSARNHEFDPVTYLTHIPPERVIQYHIAGHDDRGIYILDSHDHPVRDDVWALYAKAIPMFGEVSLMLERDEDIPPLPELLAELDDARSIHAQVTHIMPTPPPMLSELQNWMAAAIQSTTPTEGAESRLTASSSLSSTERLDIYLNDYWPRCLESLEDDFPQLAEYWGPERFNEWMTRYLTARPSQSFTLFHLPEGLPVFMGSHYHDSDRDYVLDLIAYEWAQARAYFEAQCPVFDPGQLSEAQQASFPEMGLRLQPHVFLCRVPGQVAYRVVYRYDNSVEEVDIDPLLFLMLTEFEQGRSMEAAISNVTAGLSDDDIARLSENTTGWFQQIVEKQWLVHPFISKGNSNE